MTEQHVRDEPGTSITLTVNGKPLESAADLSVHEFLHTLDLTPASVVVELNRTILRRSDFETAMIRNGDTIELVHFVGSG